MNSMQIFIDKQIEPKNHLKTQSTQHSTQNSEFSSKFSVPTRKAKHKVYIKQAKEKVIESSTAMN